MYEFIRGKLVENNAEYTVIDVMGVGYKLFTPLSLFGKLPQLGEEILLFVSYQVREISQALYGFLEREERDLFAMLINLSGIGPKTALNLIGHLSLSQFHQAIQSNNVLALSKVPGIGKKTAERLIVEMRGKKASSVLEKQSSSSHVHDALNTLLNLGFSHASAEQSIKRALEELPEGSDLSTLIATALRLKR